MSDALRVVRRTFVWIALAGTFASQLLAAQQSNKDQPSGLEAVGQQAINVILKQSELDQAALVQKTGQPLPIGKWSVGDQSPVACPRTTDACVLILYLAPEDGVSCQWVVRLVGDGTDGVILQQNEDASRYFLWKLPTTQAAQQVLTQKEPAHPPTHAKGWVTLRVFVSETGIPEKVFVVSGPKKLRDSAVDALKLWTFKPLMVGTQPARFETDVTFNFWSRTVTSEP